MFVTAPDPSFAQTLESGHAAFDINALIRDIKAKLIERSANGIRGLSRIFKAMDDNGNRQLDVDDFRWGLIDFGITISKEEASEVLAVFDRDKNGTVNFDEFLVAMRGDLNDFRRSIIRKAYDKLDVNKDGQVKLDDIATLYDVNSHPDVSYLRISPFLRL